MAPKTIVITGASDGIGLEAASQLAARGHHLVLVGRNQEKTERALQRVRHDDPAAVSHLVDMGSLSEVRELAATLLAELPVIDVLCNNAGTVFAKRELTPDGFESTFAVDHLGPFLLTELLRERLADDARVVNTASVAHRQATMDFDDLGFERGGYQIMRAYGRAKLANVLYTRELAKQFEGSGRTANALHPGAVATNIWSGAPAFAKPVLAVAKLFMVTPRDGGARIAYLADSPEVAGKSGGYYEKDRLKKPSSLALDDRVAERLYVESRRLVGLD
ncbi:MAG: SDR family NAD(P)-dependent oxidoreductase [Marmoricola sp.]